jgi:DNA repair protein SbcC/Rad50
MIFKRLKIKNIRSYKEEEFIFPSGKLLLSGDIGSGKTTILLALEFALFGLQPGQKGSSILRNDADLGEIELEFTIEDKNIIINRVLKRKKSITQESAFISINGDKKEKSITEIKDDLLKLINYPQEFSKKTNLLYRFTVYTPQEEMKQIILENPEVRLNTLRHVFGIDKYKRIKENYQIFISKIKELSKLKQGQIFDLDKLKTFLTERKNYLKEIKEKRLELNSKINNSKLELSKKEIQLQGIRDKIDEKRKIENEIEKTNILLMTKREQFFKISQEITEKNKRLSESKEKFNQEELNQLNLKFEETKKDFDNKTKKVFEYSIKIDSLETKIFDLHNLIEKISHLKTCPTCLQQVSSQHKNHIFDQTEKEIKKIDLESKKYKDNKLNIEKEIKNYDSLIKNIVDKKSFLESLKFKIMALEYDSEKIKDLEKQKNSLEKDVVLLDEQITRLKKALLSLKNFENIFVLQENEFSEISAKHKALEIQKAQTEKEIDICRNEIKNISFQINEREEIKKELEEIGEIISWFDEKFIPTIGLIEKNVMSKLRNELSNLFGKWFSILVSDNILVKLDEDFTPLIEQNNCQIDYNFLSGGEKTAIALAYRLALNQTINSVLSEIKTKGVVILDEPTDGFSQTQLDKMRDIFSQLDIEQLIIVSHDQKIESFVDNIIKLKKEQGFSKIV